MRLATSKTCLPVPNAASNRRRGRCSDLTSTSMVARYPGGIFDPFGFSKGNMAEYKLKELKNGRCAASPCRMLAFPDASVL